MNHFYVNSGFSPVENGYLREEGDSNSRGRKTKGLAILRRGQAGPSSHLEQGNKANR